MNKKLLAVAVAGALSAPGVALAQSSVTITGLFKASVGVYDIGNFQRAQGSNSQSGAWDDSSRLIFTVTEDLGGGLRAIGQYDVRLSPESGSAAATSGNSHVGLNSKSWGRIIVGRQDVHYFGRESDLTVGNDLRSDSISLLAFAGGGASAIAGATRTGNLVHYTTPNWGGFSAIVAYSFNPNAPEADIGSGQRKGYAWNVAPVFEARNWTLGYSYWSQKADVGTATTAAQTAAGVAAVTALNPSTAAGGNNADQRGDRLFGSYRWGGFRIGLAYDKSKLKSYSVASGSFVETSRRTAWSLPVEYSWGPHWIGGHYTEADNDKATAFEDGAKMWAIGYRYNMSKRTSIGFTYAQLKNDGSVATGGAVYTPFTAAGGLGSTNNSLLPGEDPKIWSMTIRHAF